MIQFLLLTLGFFKLLLLLRHFFYKMAPSHFPGCQLSKITNRRFLLSTKYFHKCVMRPSNVASIVDERNEEKCGGFTIAPWSRLPSSARIEYCTQIVNSDWFFTVHYLCHRLREFSVWEFFSVGTFNLFKFYFIVIIAILLFHLLNFIPPEEAALNWEMKVEILLK